MGNHQWLEGHAVWVCDLEFAVATGVGKGPISTDLIGEKFAAALTCVNGVEVEGHTLSGGGSALVFPTGFVFAGDRGGNAGAEGEKAEDDGF